MKNIKKTIDNYKKYIKLYKLLKQAYDNDDYGTQCRSLDNLSPSELGEFIDFMKKHIGIKAYDIIRFVDTYAYEAEYGIF